MADLRDEIRAAIDGVDLAGPYFDSRRGDDILDAVMGVLERRAVEIIDRGGLRHDRAVVLGRGRRVSEELTSPEVLVALRADGRPVLAGFLLREARASVALDRDQTHSLHDEGMCWCGQDHDGAAPGEQEAL